jgi:hypothetical protein
VLIEGEIIRSRLSIEKSLDATLRLSVRLRAFGTLAHSEDVIVGLGAVEVLVQCRYIYPGRSLSPTRAGRSNEEARSCFGMDSKEPVSTAVGREPERQLAAGTKVRSGSISLKNSLN